MTIALSEVEGASLSRSSISVTVDEKTIYYSDQWEPSKNKSSATIDVHQETIQVPPPAGNLVFRINGEDFGVSNTEYDVVVSAAITAPGMEIFSQSISSKFSVRCEHSKPNYAHWPWRSTNPGTVGLLSFKKLQ